MKTIAMITMKVDKYLSKAMTTMRKVWQVRTTVVRGWRRHGKRNAYLKGADLFQKGG